MLVELAATRCIKLRILAWNPTRFSCRLAQLRLACRGRFQVRCFLVTPSKTVGQALEQPHRTAVLLVDRPAFGLHSCLYDRREVLNPRHALLGRSNLLHWFAMLNRHWLRLHAACFSLRRSLEKLARGAELILGLLRRTLRHFLCVDFGLTDRISNRIGSTRLLTGNLDCSRLHDRALALIATALREEEEVALATRLRAVLGAGR